MSHKNIPSCSTWYYINEQNDCLFSTKVTFTAEKLTKSNKYLNLILSCSKGGSQIVKVGKRDDI